MFIKTLRSIFSQRSVRFLIAGGVGALFNLLLISITIEKLELDRPLLRNIANTICIEISIIFSFFLYRISVWSEGEWNLRKILFKQLPIYHMSTGFSVILRIFLIFPILDWLGVNYQINTLCGILFGAVINYLINDRVIFK